MTGAQQFIFALRPRRRLKCQAMKIKVKLTLRKKMIFSGTVPNGHLGASHHFGHLVPFKGLNSIPNSPLQRLPVCAVPVLHRENILVSFYASLGMLPLSVDVGNVSIYVQKFLLSGNYSNVRERSMNYSKYLRHCVLLSKSLVSCELTS